jgi:CubicO group peptidase (beta-lactamase class C family)
MKKTSWFILLFVLSTKPFAQSNSTYHYTIPLQLKDGIKTASLSEVGIDSNKIIELTDSILAGYYTNVHSLLIIRHNKLVYENYFPGEDEFFTQKLGVINHGRDSLHDCRSISKSVVSSCVGIAIGQGKIKSVNEKIFTYLPEYALYDTGMKKDITIKDLLTMSSGIEWNELIPYEDSANSERKIGEQIDPVKYYLSQRIISKPGTVWNYSAGCTYTLAAIVKKVTGLDIDAFAKQNIFDPLGISDFVWLKRANGLPYAPAGLRLRSRDMAKFGSLYLNQGKWKNKQIIPEVWTEESFKFQITIEQFKGYGYQFWCYSGPDDVIDRQITKTIQAEGRGDQRIFVNNQYDFLVVMTAGNYSQHPKQGRSPDDAFVKYVYPAIKSN